MSKKRNELLNPSGRINRTRYIAFGHMFYLGGILLVILALLIDPFLGQMVALIVPITVLVCVILLSIQRCHDFNVSGWLSLIILTGIGFIILCRIPGKDEGNRFGPANPPNSGGMITLSVLMPMLFYSVSMLLFVYITFYALSIYTGFYFLAIIFKAIFSTPH